MDRNVPSGRNVHLELFAVSAVIIYLAIIISGRIVVPIADSFAAKEIATCLRVSQTKGIFTQVVFSLSIFCVPRPQVGIT